MKNTKHCTRCRTAVILTPGSQFCERCYGLTVGRPVAQANYERIMGATVKRGFCGCMGPRCRCH